MMNSSSKESPQQKRNGNESKNITTILPPEITSTPFISNKTKIGSPLVTPTRKFLGPRRYALSNNGMLNPVRTIKDPPGPLLASTSYNVNVSTYIDTKSPGYAGRLVQYNEETSRKQQNTHQERYGSPGLFPIVHLFKKEVPVISPKLKKGTIRIGTPESRGYYSQEHNRSLLEGIVRNNSILKEQNNSNEVSTRSVLDALKEISRKRIHANEEYDPIDDNNKKFRKSNGDGDYSKRNRVESPPSEKANSPSTTQAKKRLCTIDAVLASKTSSMYANYEMGTKRKSFEDSNSRILPVNKKKYNNVETQTPETPVIVRELKRITVTKENDNKKKEEPVEESEVEEEISSSPKQVLKVLDDKPLEVIRKNRLGALLSALSGREIPSIPMEDRRKALDQDWPSQSSEKTLISILSPPKKQTKSIEKHVTFDLTQNTELTQSNSSTNISENVFTNSDKKETNVDTMKEQGKFLPMSSEKNSSEGEKASLSFIQTSNENVLNTNSTSHTLDAPEEKKGEKEKIVGGFKFDLSKPFNPKSSIPDISQSKKVEENKTNPENTSNFSLPSSSFTPIFGTTPSKLEGGTISTKSTVETSFTKSPSAPMTNSLGLPTSLPLSTPTIVSGTTSPPGSFTFGSKTVSEAISVPTNSIGKTTAVFTLGKKETLPSGLENSAMTFSSNTLIAPTLGKNESLGFNSSPFGSKIESIAPTFAFNGINNVSTISTTSFNIPAGSSLTSSSDKSEYPTSTTTSLVCSISSPTVLAASDFTSKTFDTLAANSTTSKSNFGTSASSPGGFKFNSGNSLPAFGSPSVNSATTPSGTIASNLFGSSLNNVATSTKSEFEKSSVTNSPFGAVPTSNASSAMFGNNLLSNKTFTPDSKTFGSANDINANSSHSSPNTAFTFKTSQSGVSTTNTTASTASNLSFGSTLPSFGTTGNMFPPGKNQIVPSFGAPSTASSLGTSNSFTFGKANSTSLTTSIPSNSLFTSTNTAAFGSTTNSFIKTNTPSFGTTNTPSFGNTNTPSFAATNTPNFGTSNTLAFGTTNTPTFGTTKSTPSFGNSSSANFATTSTSAFGTTNKPSFSNSNTSTFGSTDTPPFGNTNPPPFGSANIPNFAASKTPSFGSINPPAFGATSGTPTFGTTNTPAFGSTNITATNNTFGVASAPVPVNTPSFGTPTFGNATTTSNFGTSFSTTSTLSLPSFGNPSSPFGNTITSNANTFNSNNSSLPFSNASGTNSFGNFNSNNPQFTPVTTAPSFGTNTSNTFGNSSATHAFGATATNNTFGSSNPAGPFGANTTKSSNAFASGFGKKPEQSSSIFPSSSNNMFNSNSTFGSVQSNNNGGTTGSSTSGVFTFGSSNSNAPSSAGVFTFGSSEPPKTFNFNNAATPGNIPTPSSSGFNSGSSFGQSGPVVPNMFSIGSGNAISTTQARGRPLVRARRRT